MHHQSRAISSPPQCRQLKFHLFNYFSNLLLVRFEEALLPRKDENNVFVSVEELRSNSEINRNVVSVVFRISLYLHSSREIRKEAPAFSNSFINKRDYIIRGGK